MINALSMPPNTTDLKGKLGITTRTTRVLLVVKVCLVIFQQSSNYITNSGKSYCKRGDE